MMLPGVLVIVMSLLSFSAVIWSEVRSGALSPSPASGEFFWLAASGMLVIPIRSK